MYKIKFYFTIFATLITFLQVKSDEESDIGTCSKNMDGMCGTYCYQVVKVLLANLASAQSKEKQFFELQSKVKELEEVISIKDSQLAQQLEMSVWLKDIIITKEELLNTLKNDKIANLQNEITLKNITIIEKNNIIQEKKNIIKDKDAELSAIKSKMSENDSEKASIKNQINVKDNQMAELNKEINEQKNLISVKENDIKNKEAELSAIKSKMSENDSEITSIKNQIKIKDNQISELNKEINVNKKFINVKENDVKNKESQIKVKDDQISLNTVKIKQLEDELFKYKTASAPSSCLGKSTDVHAIQVPRMEEFSVPCDSTLAGSGWTVIQRRIDGSVNFTRNWNEYKNGFGNLRGEFFIGLEKLYLLTNSQPHELYIHLINFKNEIRFAKYSHFAIGNEEEKYKLKSVGDYSGTAGNSLQNHINFAFSTIDKNDYLSSVQFKSGWWFFGGYSCNLNGLFAKNGKVEIVWLTWKGGNPIKNVQMMIRPHISDQHK